ncbi:hypothetical protein Plhal304r1_c006g0025651 [Plasmopara halstedii]
MPVVALLKTENVVDMCVKGSRRNQLWLIIPTLPLIQWLSRIAGRWAKLTPKVMFPYMCMNHWNSLIAVLMLLLWTRSLRVR